jgi:hypothetical protein
MLKIIRINNSLLRTTTHKILNIKIAIASYWADTKIWHSRKYIMTLEMIKYIMKFKLSQSREEMDYI